MGKRIEYIDAMRGLAMLLVVIGHVFYFSFKDTDNILFQILSLEIEIPLFFTVSGFLIKFPERNYLSFFKKKAFLLCVPATIFMLIYAWIEHHNYFSVWTDSYKDGYWFTFSLFEFIVIYTVLKIISKKKKLNVFADNLFVLVIAFVLLFASTWCMNVEKTYFFIPLLGLIQFKSFVFFVLGTIIAEHNILGDNSYIKHRITYLLFICLALHIYTYKEGCINYIGSYSLWMAITTIMGILVIYCGFKHYESWNLSWIGKKLQMIGRYTLDIYFIHYFFLPRNLNIIGAWFKINSNPIIEYLLAVFIAIILIVASLLIGRIIRLSPLLAHWLLAENIIIEKKDLSKN